MSNQALSVVMLESVEYVEEILTSWQTAFSEVIRKVKHELCILLHQRPEGADTQFIIHWHLHSSDLLSSKQFLLIYEYKL